jgi:hypothetical protein
MNIEDETIYKAQAKQELVRPNTSTAALLIFGGLTLLVASLAGVSLLELFAPLLFVGGLGVLMLLPTHKATAEQPSQWSFLAGPGGLLLTLGSLLFLMGLVNHFEAWAYAWALLPVGFVLGMMYAQRFDEEHRIHQRGAKVIRFFISGFMILALFFELLVFESLGPWWPLLLVGTGAYMLWQKKA